MPIPSVEISVSIVSHLQGEMIHELLLDLERCNNTYSLEIILTLNIPEYLPFGVNDFSFPIVLIVNTLPKGFSANHNQAFRKSTGLFYCVMNPDIRLVDNPYQALLPCFQDSKVGMAAPMVLSDNGILEDSARRFPTPFKIVCKLFGGCRGNDYALDYESARPDWVAGMFQLFSRGVFEILEGFDEHYFLYYEDVDICARLKLLGYEISLSHRAKVIHHAQRSSHRNLKYLRWHLTSMTRFFLSSVFRRLLYRNLL